LTILSAVGIARSFDDCVSKRSRLETMSMSDPIGDPPPGCTCGPWWGVVPPGPCPYHCGTGCGCSYGCPCAKHYTTTTDTKIVINPVPTVELSDLSVDRIARRLKELLAEDDE
jgi:hypothetical protein